MPISPWIRRLVGVVAFFAIGLALYGYVTDVLKPYQTTSLMTDKADAFYGEPSNTVEVLFLGPSTTTDGFIPTQLYEEQGICSYNLGTSAQPMLVSYALAQETYRLHPTTLRTIVIDCATIRYKSADGMYRLALDEIPLTSKYRQVMEWENSKDDKLVYLDPAYAYHNRWSELTAEDWAKPFYPAHDFLRGYEPLWNRTTTEGDISKLTMPRLVPDATAEPTPLTEEGLHYFNELVDFCDARGIELVMVKTPLFGAWTDSDHNALDQLARENGLTFLDLNYEPFFSQTGYNQSLDTRDYKHPNDSGAAKITSYIGAYLSANGLGTDVRGDPAFAFMDDQVRDFHAVTSDLADLRSNVDPVDYLAEAMENPDYTLFIGVDGEGARRLDADQRRRLDEMGFEWLASMDADDCYRAVVRDGKVVNEDLSTRADTRLYTNYTSEDLTLPRSAYFQMFKSSDPEAMEALAYDTDPEDVEQPEWTFAVPGLTVIAYDELREMVVDCAYFRSWLGLRRYYDPQAVLDEKLALGAQEWELPWVLQELEHYDNDLATELRDFYAPPPAPEGQPEDQMEETGW